MNPKDFLISFFFSPRNLIKDEHGQLYCVLSVISELSNKLETYFPKLTFEESTMEETKEYWIEKTTDYLKDLEGCESQMPDILKRYDNVWDGVYDSIGDKWIYQVDRSNLISKWKSSIWYLLNISTYDENQIIRGNGFGTSFTVNDIEQWQRDKAVILDYHYEQLLTNLSAKLKAPEVTIRHSQNATLNSIDKYKVVLLIYTKLRSYGWSHSNIKPHFAKLAIAMLDDFSNNLNDALPSNWNNWLQCPLRLFPNLINDEALLKTSISEMQKYHSALDNYFIAKDLRLKSRISRNSIRENLAVSLGRTSSVFNTNIQNQGVDEDKLSGTINQLRQVFIDLIDDRQEREFQKFLDQNASYLS